MSEVFLKVFNMSITASWVILAVLIFRLVFKKAPKWTRCLLWGIAALRLIFPFSIQSMFSLIPSARTIPDTFITEPQFNVNSGISRVDSPVNGLLDSRYAEGVTVPADSGRNVTEIIGYIWIAGIIILLIFAAVSYLRLMHQVRASVKYRDNIYICDDISSPFILGIIKPKIYIPSGLSDIQKNHILAHESAHIRRRDYIIKPLAFVLLSVYWFNPVLWLAYYLLCRDIELACDEKVLKSMGEDDIADYSQTLLDFSTSKRMITVCPVAFGETGVKQRVKNALNYKKPAFWIIIAAVIVSIVAAVCFLTDPSDKAEINENIDPALNKAVSQAILENNKDSFKDSEFVSQGHIIMGTQEDDGILKAYILENVNSYQVVNGYFTDTGGFLDSVVMTFEHSGENYVYKKTDHTEDGALLKDSVKRLFPKEYQKRAVSIPDADRDYMNRICRESAKEYLVSANRAEIIKDYSDIDFKLLTDVGVPVELGNKLTENEYPDFIGFYVKAEDGVKYVYQTSYLKEQNIIIYTKYLYEDNTVVSLTVIDGSTGEIESAKSGDLYKDGYFDRVDYDSDGDGIKETCTIAKDASADSYILRFSAVNDSTGKTVQSKQMNYDGGFCFFYPSDKLYIIEIGLDTLNVYVTDEIK